MTRLKVIFGIEQKDKKRKTYSFKELKNKKSLEIIYEKETDRYFLYSPVEVDFFPTDDNRNDNQGTFFEKKGRIISLDPGIRKFMVGYDPQGSSIFIGDKASIELTKLLLEIDKRISKNKPTQDQQRYVKNLVNELHWKTISFLIKNYDVILLPDFRVKQMVKGRRLANITKRLMMMFSFYKFQERLTYKCKSIRKKVIDRR